MAEITVNFDGYDEISNSLIVSFTDGEITTRQLAFQPFNFSDQNIEVIKRNLAVTGKDMIERLRRENQFLKSNAKQQEFKDLVGTSASYDDREIAEAVRMMNDSLEVEI
jgi:K+-transporting ATPase c subunit